MTHDDCESTVGSVSLVRFAFLAAGVSILLSEGLLDPTERPIMFAFLVAAGVSMISGEEAGVAAAAERNGDNPTINRNLPSSMIVLVADLSTHPPSLISKILSNAISEVPRSNPANVKSGGGFIEGFIFGRNMVTSFKNEKKKYVLMCRRRF